MDPRKPTGEILSVFLLEGMPLYRWFIAEGRANCAGRDGSPSQTIVLLMASSHTSASVEVLRWLLCPNGGTETLGVKAMGEGGGGAVGEYTGTQIGHSVCPKATCRHLHLGRSIRCHKQLRVSLENRIYWFSVGVNRERRYFWYSQNKSALLMFSS